MSAPLSRPKNCDSIGVSIIAGRIALDRMPSSPSRTARDFISSTMPPLVIEYGAALRQADLAGHRGGEDDIEPLPSAARSNGSAYLVAKKALRWLTSTALAHSSQLRYPPGRPGEARRG